MKLGRAESVRAAVNKSPTREQRHARGFAREAPHWIEYRIVVIVRLVHSCLLVVVSKNIAVSLASPGGMERRRMLSVSAILNGASLVSNDREPYE